MKEVPWKKFVRSFWKKSIWSPKVILVLQKSFWSPKSHFFGNWMLRSIITHLWLTLVSRVSHLPIDDFRPWNFINTSLHSGDIVIIGFLGKTGNGIVLAFQWDSHFPVDDFRLWNSVKSSFLARDIVIIWLLD